MSTTIEWTHVPGYRGDVWNPTTGCNKVSQGCKHCYAETMHRRLHAMGMKGYERPFLDGARPVPERLPKPLRTKTPTAYFVNSMSDLFHADVPFSYIDQVFAVMALCPQHIFIVLTKRPERMAEYFNDATHPLIHTSTKPALVERWSDATYTLGLADRSDDIDAPPCHVHNRAHANWPLPNVWLGTSVENQATADARIPHLLKCPAAVRFLSCEPLLGAVDLKAVPLVHQANAEGIVTHTNYGPHPPRTIDWVIVGGESGPKARPMHPHWARGLRDQCQAAGVPFFFKQWGEHKPGLHPDLHTIHERGVALGVDGAHQERRPYSRDSVFMKKVGKHEAGRLLDGVEHNVFPRTR